MEKNKTLITGGAGYIGSHTIVEALPLENTSIVSVDNYSNSTENTYNRVNLICEKKFTHYNIDLSDLNACKDLFNSEKNIENIIHFAAFKSVPESVSDPLKYYSNNINSLTNLLSYCKKTGVKNFIFSSSCSVYGNVTELPVNEDTPLGICESPYAYTKVIGERIILDFAKSNPEINFICLRYFNPVGAHMSGKLGEIPQKRPDNLVPIITGSAVGKYPDMYVHGNDYNTRDGSCIRDYIHVSDIANAHILALKYLWGRKNKSNFEIFNLGSGNGVTVLEAIESFEKVSGLKLKYFVGPRRLGDVEAIYSDSSLSNTLLEWKPLYGIDDMMESAWVWEQQLRNELLTS